MMIDGIEQTQHRLILTGLYIAMNDERAVKALIRRWRFYSGVDDPAKENFVQRWFRQLRGKPVPTRGYIHCDLEMEMDQLVYTAHFYKLRDYPKEIS